MLEPRFTVPESIVGKTLLRTSDSRLQLFEEQFRFRTVSSTRLMTETQELESLLKWLGALKTPVEIVVDEKTPDRLLVTDARIEIGADILAARGQLSKALLKTWILQNTSLSITSSHLRTEVASDVLLAMLSGHLRLEVPGQETPLTYAHEEKAWWTYADSYKGVCESAWRSLELAPLCATEVAKSDSMNVSALSFRQFLGQRIWRSYEATPIQDRLLFVRHWVQLLETEHDDEVHSLKEGWLSVVQGELEALLPLETDPLKGERARFQPKVEAPLIVIDGEGHVGAPGTLRITSNELEFAPAVMIVMTGCKAPTLGEVISLPITSERVVWRPECAERKTDFVQVRPSAIRMAIAKGIARASDKIDDFVLNNRDLANATHEKWLGLAQAKWDEEANAFRVRGALSAVEIFRLNSKKPL